MSKRFGRNQKRAMRNKIQNQENLLNAHIDQIGSLNTRLHQANEIINLTADILGQHFVGLPVKTNEVKELLRRYEYAIHQPVSNLLPALHNPMADLVDAALGYIETHQGVVYADELRDQVHMRYTSESGDVAYGLSNMAWCRLSEDQLVKLVKDQIAPDMAKLLVRERKKSQSYKYPALI